QVELAGGDGRGDGGGAGLADEEAEPGVGLAEGGDDRREEVGDGGGAAADADRATLEAGQLADGPEAGVGAAHGFLGVEEEEAAGVGELDAAPGAVEEVGAGLGLELAEHGGEGRLSDAEGPGGAGHVAGTGDGE